MLRVVGRVTSSHLGRFWMNSWFNRPLCRKVWNPTECQCWGTSGSFARAGKVIIGIWWLLNKSLAKWKSLWSKWSQFQVVKAVWVCEKSEKQERNQYHSKRTRDLTVTSNSIHYSLRTNNCSQTAPKEATWAAVGLTTRNKSLQIVVPHPCEFSRNIDKSESCSPEVIQVLLFVTFVWNGLTDCCEMLTPISFHISHNHLWSFHSS